MLALPGADFAAYRWGDTIDPIEPGLMDRPYVARELVPWGSEAATNLLIALDRRVQEEWLEPQALAPIARLMGVGDVLLRNDLLTDEFNLVAARAMWKDLTRFGRPAGLGTPTSYGTTIPGTLLAPDLGDVSEPPVTDPKPVVVFPVKDPTPIARVKPISDTVVVDGDGEGLVDAAASGVIDGTEVVLSSPSYEQQPVQLHGRVPSGALLVLTDSNRRRGMRWAGMKNNYGYTETAGERPLREDLLDQRLDVFPGSTDESRTVTEMRGVRSVRATTYGTPAFGYAADGRPALALDGDTKTAWEVAAGVPKVGHERLVVELDHPITTDRLGLVQAFAGKRGRWITRMGVRFDGGPQVVHQLNGSSRSRAGQELLFARRTFSRIELQILGTDANKPGKVASEAGRLRKTGVGVAELRLQDDAPGAAPVRAREVTRMPEDLLTNLGAGSGAHRSRSS